LKVTFTTEIDRQSLRSASERAEARPVGGARDLVLRRAAPVPTAASAPTPAPGLRRPSSGPARPGAGRRHPSRWAGFAAASVAVHGVAVVALGAGGEPSHPVKRAASIVEFAVFAPALVAPEDVEAAAPVEPAPVERAPAPEPVTAPPRPAPARTSPERPRPRADEVAPAEPASQGAAVSATPSQAPGGAAVADAAGALAVPAQAEGGDGPLGPGGAGAGGAARVGASASGSGGAAGPGAAAAAEPRVDRRALARAWMEEVSRILLERARRNYPRSALRTGREGTVMLAITVDPAGRIGAVRVDTPSGVEALDESAVESVHEVGAVPPPPAALAWQTRALRMPIVYRIR
jgi:TonB family protein